MAAGVPDVTDDRAVSVLDLGSGTVKALVVDPGPPTVTILGAAATPAPPADSSGARPLEDLVAACEQALVMAEDQAGVVPVRACFGLTAQRAAVSVGEAEAQRANARPPLGAEEVQSLFRRAEHAALAGARRRDAAEFPTATALCPLDAAIITVEVDGREIGNLAGESGARLRLSLAAAFAPQPLIEQVDQLAERLDLETAGLLLAPFALGGALAQAGHGPALVVDAGADLTQVALIGEQWTEALVTLPLGGSDLIARVAAELGLTPMDAHNAVAAHAAGASPRGAQTATGPGVARVVRRLAQHHAEVWLDALGVACAELGRTRPLPAALLLCGGAAGIPEIWQALQGAAWHADLPFESPPITRRLTPRDVPAIVVRAGGLPALQVVPALGLAAVAAGAYRPPARFATFLPPHDARRPGRGA